MWVIILNVSSHTLRRMNNIDMILRGPENAENCDCFRGSKCDFRDEMTYIGNRGRLGDRDNGWIFNLIVESKEGGKY